jgi:hypothetical protein
VNRVNAVGVPPHFAVEIALEDGPRPIFSARDGPRHHRPPSCDVAPRLVGAVIAAYPRLEFKRGFADLIADQAARKPNCWAAAATQVGIADSIVAAPFAS